MLEAEIWLDTWLMQQAWRYDKKLYLVPLSVQMNVQIV